MERDHIFECTLILDGEEQDKFRRNRMDLMLKLLPMVVPGASWRLTARANAAMCMESQNGVDFALALVRIFSGLMIVDDNDFCCR